MKNISLYRIVTLVWDDLTIKEQAIFRSVNLNNTEELILKINQLNEDLIIYLLSNLIGEDNNNFQKSFLILPVLLADNKNKYFNILKNKLNSKLQDINVNISDLIFLISKNKKYIFNMIFNNADLSNNYNSSFLTFGKLNISYDTFNIFKNHFDNDTLDELIIWLFKDCNYHYKDLMYADISYSLNMFLTIKMQYKDNDYLIHISIINPNLMLILITTNYNSFISINTNELLDYLHNSDLIFN